MPVRPEDVLAFWLAAGPDKWFAKDTAFDGEVRARFAAAHAAATAGRLESWAANREGALALVILLDQFSRNLHRGNAQAFAADAKARAIAAAALARGFDAATPMPLRPFFYLPFMHSEDPADQARSLALYRALGDAELLKYAEEHADIIRRFGRFPHRNAVLGRTSTAEEQAFLDAGGFAG
ncbi:MAG TPA: DUF924 family protein [Xanthobacteraceae bacterium]|nr:DUF924 family protein [Xanthobacteraceae bacterium]